jgi:hypothetical protein
VFFVAGAGFALYRGTLGRLVMVFSEVIVFAIETGVRYFLFFLFFPVRFVFHRILAAVQKSCAHARKIQSQKKRIRYTESEFARIQKNACGLIFEDCLQDLNYKRGKKSVKEQKTVQSDVAHPDFAGYADHRVHRSVRIQRHAVQRADGRESRARGRAD